MTAPGSVPVASPTAPVVALAGLRFRWPGAPQDTVALDALQVAAGQAVFLHGPSGCGKSTLLGLLAGVLLPQTGQVAVLGQAWQALGAARRDAWRADHVGYIFQQFNLLPYLSVLDNVRLPTRFSALRRQRALAQGDPGTAEALLRRVELPEALWQGPASALSVGQQQRVAAARALIGAPALVIADEPTSALDAHLRDTFMALLREATAASGAALVFVSHDERLAEGFATRWSLPALNRAAGVVA
jgi:putative ABC transport system ATP-binding protein